MENKIIDFPVKKKESSSVKFKIGVALGTIHSIGIAMTLCGRKCFTLSDIAEDHRIYFREGKAPYLGLLAGEVLGSAILPVVGVASLVHLSRCVLSSIKDKDSANEHYYSGRSYPCR